MLSESYINRIKELGGVLNELSSEEIYKKYYAEKINPGNFINIVSSDPTSIVDGDNIKKMGNYSKWLLSLFLKNNLKLEDLYKATEYLTFLEKNKNALKNNGVSLDINKYENLPSLFKTIHPFIGKNLNAPDVENVENENELVTNDYFIDSGEAKKIELGNGWVVFIPKTLRASQFYGCDSQWCTIKPDNFKYYTQRGDLYIFVDKNKLNSGKSSRRIQVHLNENQFMDMDDDEIDKKEWLDENPEILNFLFNIEKQNLKNNPNYVVSRGKYYIVKEGWEDFATEFKDNSEISEESIKKILSGDAWGIFEYDSDNFEIQNIMSSISDDNKLEIKKLIVIEYPELKRKKFKVEDILRDYDYDLSEIKDAIKISYASAQESADESEAFDELTKAIKNHYDIISVKWAKRKKADKESKFLIQIPESTFKMLGIFDGDDDDSKINYSPPYYVYQGEIDDAYFNENLSDKLSELFPKKEKTVMRKQAAESIIRKLVRDVLNEDYRFEYDKTHTPTDEMSRISQKAKQAISQNSLIANYKAEGGVVTGEKRAAKIINKEPFNHDEVRAVRDLFVSLQDELNQAKNSGKTIANSPVIQIWELNGGEVAKNWANNILGTHHTKSLKHKENRRGFDGVGLTKGLMKVRLPKKQNPK